MKKFSMRMRVLTAVVSVAALAAVGGYAYFTANGSGSGTATVGDASAITLDATITGTLYPDGAAADVDVLVQNPGAGSQFVDTITIDSVEVDTASGTYTGASGAQQTIWDGCEVSSSNQPYNALTNDVAFSMADVSVNETLTADDLSGGGTDETTKSGELQMNDTGVSQNDCKNAPLKLNLTSN